MTSARQNDSPPALERLGIRLLRRWARASPTRPHDDPVYVIDAQERGALRRVERGAVVRSAVAGGISGLVSALGVFWADASFSPDAADPTTGQHLLYWSVVLGVAGVAAIIEIVYLYWDALRATHLLADAAGLALFDEADERIDRPLAGALARAALELPNSAEPRLGVNPLREASRARLITYSLVYKGKIAVTNFLLKAIVRRAMGRALVRGAMVELVAIPVTAAWNALVTWRVMREARLRVMGPSAAAALVDGLWQLEGPQSPQRGGAMRAVASAIVRSTDLHPNLLALLHEVREHPGEDSAAATIEDLDDTERFLTELEEAPRAEQRWLVGVLTLAAVIDGKLTRGERELLTRARRAAGLPEGLEDTVALERRFETGRPIRAEQLAP